MLRDIERATTTRLTIEDGADSYPVWTPEGDVVTFASNRTGNFSIFELPVDGSRAATRLLDESRVVAVPGSWSPDGNTLVFYEVGSTAERDIKLLSRDGQMSEFLATEFNEWAPRLSPDGSWLAFVSDRSGDSQVYVQRFPEGGAIIPVSSGSGAEPVWSRNGSELFYRDGFRMLAVEVDAGDEFGSIRVSQR